MKITVFLIAVTLILQAGCLNKDNKNCEVFYINKSADLYREICSDKDSTFIVLKETDPAWISYKYKLNNRYFVEIFSRDDSLNKAYFLEIKPCRFDISKSDRIIKNGLSIEYQGQNYEKPKIISFYKNDSLDGQLLHFNEKGILDWEQTFEKNKLIRGKNIKNP